MKKQPEQTTCSTTNELPPRQPSPGGKPRRYWEPLRVITQLDPETKVSQAYHDATDVNKIVARFQRDGYLPPRTTEQQYADVTALQGDLTERWNEAQQTIREAEIQQAALRKERREIEAKLAPKPQTAEPPEPAQNPPT